MQDRIHDALRRGAHDEALTLAREAVATNPRDAQAHRLLAMALNAGGDRDAALLNIDHAIALAPDDADLYFHRAGYLLGQHEIDAAQAALSQSVQLDPNQFGAYVLQAQLAIARGDLDEAERIGRLAARVAPTHPWTQMLEGTVALRRGDADRALAVLSEAARQAPDDAQIRYSLGFAYLQLGHHAFAEQAFRGILDSNAGAGNLRGLIADLQLRQDRAGDAAETLAPLLASDNATPALRRFGGELELAAGRLDRALPLLRSALAAQPDDARALAAIFQVWHRKNDREDARQTLDAALATSPGVVDLWRARLAVEAVGSDEVLALIERWLDVAADPLPALEMQLQVHGLRGDQAQAEATAQRILDLQPAHTPAHMRLVNGLLQREPERAVAYLESLLADTVDTGENEDNAVRRLQRAWLGLALDRAGRFAAAAQTWVALQAEAADIGLPLPKPSTPPPQWPAIAEVPVNAAPVAFLVGAPGASVERAATLLGACFPSFRNDRFGATPPQDALQNVHTAARLADGQITAAEVARDWRDHLPARGLVNEQVIDWLLWWDNAWLLVLHAHLPQARLIVALRDPRDMLLDWLAFGAPVRFQVPSAIVAAAWLSTHLQQFLVLQEESLFPHTLLRMDEIVNDEAAVADALGIALQTQLPVPPAGMFGPPRFGAGHWRNYADALAEPFALLVPVAQRLGYPAD